MAFVVSDRYAATSARSASRSPRAPTIPRPQNTVRIGGPSSSYSYFVVSPSDGRPRSRPHSALRDSLTTTPPIGSGPASGAARGFLRMPSGVTIGQSVDLGMAINRRNEGPAARSRLSGGRPEVRPQETRIPHAPGASLKEEAAS